MRIRIVLDIDYAAASDKATLTGVATSMIQRTLAEVPGVEFVSLEAVEAVEAA